VRDPQLLGKQQQKCKCDMDEGAVNYHEQWQKLR
jgi:hypothetical protein